MTWEQNVVDADTGRELAKGEVVVVAYDYRAGKTISIPQQWREKIISFEGLKVEG
jgi:acyl-CoA thioesterase FadM